MWYIIESPFGRIAHTVDSNGNMYLKPSNGLKVWHDHVLDEDVHVPQDEPYYGDEGRPALTINGKRYGEQLGGVSLFAEVGKNTGILFLSGLSHGLTPSAFDKLQGWVREHYPEMVTVERIARAKWDKARSDVYYRLKDVQDATAALNAAIAERQQAYELLQAAAI